jgi:hypothetical protein
LLHRRVLLKNIINIRLPDCQNNISSITSIASWGSPINSSTRIETQGIVFIIAALSFVGAYFAYQTIIEHIIIIIINLLGFVRGTRLEDPKFGRKGRGSSGIFLSFIIPGMIFVVIIQQ